MGEGGEWRSILYEGEEIQNRNTDISRLRFSFNSGQLFSECIIAVLAGMIAVVLC